MVQELMSTEDGGGVAAYQHFVSSVRTGTVARYENNKMKVISAYRALFESVVSLYQEREQDKQFL